LELDGEDLRRVPIEERKARLAGLLRKPLHGIALNEHFAGDGGRGGVSARPAQSPPRTAQAAKRAAADIEGHSTAAEHGQQGRLSWPRA
jgi:hypothetical protein